MSEPDGKFDWNNGKSNGVTIKEYFEGIMSQLVKSNDDKIRELKEDCNVRVKELEEKITLLIGANDKLYIAKFLSSENAVREAFAASQQAINKSELSQEKRSDAVYVSISALQKALTEVISRGEFALSNKNTDDKYDIIKKTVSDIQIIMSNFLTTAAYEPRHTELQRQVNDLRESRSEGAGKTIGGEKQWSMILSLISLTATMIAIITFAVGAFK